MSESVFGRVRDSESSVPTANDPILFVLNEEKTVVRADGTSFVIPSAWGLPGGGVEQGESELDALIRELEEESGLSAIIGPFWTDDYDQYHVVRVADCWRPRGTLRPNIPEGILACRWMTVPDIVDHYVHGKYLAARAAVAAPLRESAVRRALRGIVPDADIATLMARRREASAARAARISQSAREPQEPEKAKMPQSAPRRDRGTPPIPSPPPGNIYSRRRRGGRHRS